MYCYMLVHVAQPSNGGPFVQYHEEMYLKHSHGRVGYRFYLVIVIPTQIDEQQVTPLHRAAMNGGTSRCL